jgi:integrase
MALTNTTVTKAKPKEKPYKLGDERGLYLLVKPNGTKAWRMKYRASGSEKLLAFGVFPDLSLADARDMRDEARTQLAKGIDPGVAKQAAKTAQAGAESFEAIAREWFVKYSPNWVAHHGDKILRRLERDVFPWIGTRPVKDVKAPELLAALRRIESRGALETAHRALQNCGQVFRYAVATGRAERDPTNDLRGALPPPQEKHHASITKPDEIGALLRAIRGYSGSLVTACALNLAPLVFVRPGELRHAEWPEFDLDGSEWRLPAEKMKARVPHIVPLPRQAVAILHELQPLTGAGRYIFPGLRSAKRPMSENTVNGALRRLGYAKDQMTGHGFRSMASTLLNEQGWHRDAIERQLAHGERDNMRAAYNYAEHLPERRKMMQAWADYLDRLAAGERKVTSIKRATAVS